MDDLVLFTGIRDYIYARINFFTEQVLSQNLTLALTIVLALLTLWVMVQGYLIATGRSQEGLKGFLYGLGKSYFIIALALAVAGSSSFSTRLLTEGLADGISQIMTGSSDMGSECLLEKSSPGIGCKIDRNLKLTQGFLASLNDVDTADDDYLEGKLTQARWFSGVGTAGPAIVAGTMLIVFRIAMALFVGFAPIFILCLLFKKTAPLFQKWLFYGLATIFSGVMLGVMSDIAMDLVLNLWGSAQVGNLIANFFTGSGSAGIMQTVTQQLGVGLILSTLLITVPPMAGLWFNGMMGSYTGYNAMAGLGGGNSTVPGQNNYQQQVENRVAPKVAQLDRDYGANQTSNTVNNPFIYKNQINSPTNGQASDSFKHQSQLGQATHLPIASIIKPEGNTDKAKNNTGEKA